jgi:hypothetical protein
MSRNQYDQGKDQLTPTRNADTFRGSKLFVREGYWCVSRELNVSVQPDRDHRRTNKNFPMHCLLASTSAYTIQLQEKKQGAAGCNTVSLVG